MSSLDWMVLLLPLLVVAGAVIYSCRFTRSVADFLTGRRAAGRYLISVSRGQQGMGAVMFVGLFEVFYQSGFTTMWWQQLAIPVGLMVSITGFVFYRYRQTRVMTLAQFFEVRYSRRFRIFTGALGFFAGIMNFGIIPCLGARFFVNFLELPIRLEVFSHQVPTYLILMGCFLTLSVLMTVVGGQVTILVGGCLEGFFSQIGLLIVAIALFLMFPLSAMRQVLLEHSAGSSFVNPFDSFATKDFNLGWVLMGLFLNNIYGAMAWQNCHAFNASGTTPHEARMGNFVGGWIAYTQVALMAILAFVMLTFLGHPGPEASGLQASLHRLTDPTMAEMRMPIILAHLLPPGIKGLVCAIVLMGVITGDGIHLLSWSSIFVQDVLMPLRSAPLVLQEHLLWLRGGIVGVAFFAFVFGSLFIQTDYVLMWFQLTTVIFVGGAGAAIIGGLYWNRGTTEGAWVGMVTGSVLSVGGIIARALHPEIPLNGTQIAFIAALVAIAAYVGTSLLSRSAPYDMDRLLHSGKYSPNEAVEIESNPTERFSIGKIIGIDDQFTLADRWVAYGAFWWSVGWFAVVLAGSTLEVMHPFSSEAWVTYWLWAGVGLPLVIASLICVWTIIGGSIDMLYFFRSMRTQRIDVHDDGMVDNPEKNSLDDV